MYDTVTLTGTYLLPEGTPALGSVEIIPSEKVIVDSAGDVILSGRAKVKLDETGSFSVDLPATDDPNLNPTGFGYTVAAKLHHAHLKAVSFQLPAAVPVVDVADVTTVDPSTFTPGVTYVSAAELTALEGEVDLKANAADVSAALALKANASSLAAKADATRVDTLETLTTSGRLSDSSLTATSAALAKPPAANGGQHPKPFRVPTLTIQRDWPNQAQDYTVLWAQGLTAYSVAGDYSIRKSTDGGATWTRKTTTAMTWQMGYRGGFLKTTANTLLAWENGSAGTPRIYRSTDDGATWTSVHTMRAGMKILSPQSWCQDLNTGHLFYGEYDDAGTQATIRVYRSTDDGATWAQFHEWPGLGGGTASTQVKHVHACQYDSVSQRVYVSVGDVSDSAGIYRVNAGGTALEVVALNSQMGGIKGVGAAGHPTMRAVALMFFPTHLAWVTDDTFGNFCRMARTQIGQPSPVVEVIHTALASGWATCRAASDGSTWVATVDSDMPGQIDSAGHVYGVSDNGATVWEIGAIPAPNVSVGGTLVPVGQAELHDGTSLWLASSLGFDGNSGRPEPLQFRATLAKSSSVSLVGPRRKRKHQPPTSISSGLVTVAASATTVFGGTTAPASPENLLYILDWGIYRTSGTGVCALQIVTVSNGTNVIGNQGPTAQFRTGRNSEEEFALAGLAVTAGSVVEFRITEVGGTQPATCQGWVTFAWGPKITQSLL